MASKRDTPDVHVVLDTNCLFTDAADKLLSPEISNFILDEVEETGVSVRWYIPGVVKAERKYQMYKRGTALLPSLKKIERLLGHQLGITETILESRIDDAISSQIQTHGLSELDIQPSAVDWHRLIDDSVKRLPPFEAGESEKGFRDAIILESFIQFSDNLPKFPQICRVVFLSGDELLLTALKARTAGRQNVYTADALDGIRTMLNAISASLSQENVKNLVAKASKFFFDKRDPIEFYYKGRVWDAIRENFGSVLDQRPAGGGNLGKKSIMIAPATFLRKEKQRVFFSTRVTVDQEATEIRLFAGLGAERPAGQGLLASNRSIDYAALLGNLAFPNSDLSSIPGSTISGGDWAAQSTTLPATLPEPQKIFSVGKHIFEVFWSATLNRRGALIKATMDGVDHKSSDWQQA